MPKLPKSCFKQRKHFQAYYRDTHTAESGHIWRPKGLEK